MSKSDTLRHGPPGESAVHLCVDMQRMFAEGTEWKMPWLERVLPNIIAVTSVHPERTIFTRFIPAEQPGHGVGMWRHYYERWASMTIDRIGSDMVGLVPGEVPQRNGTARLPVDKRTERLAEHGALRRLNWIADRRCFRGICLLHRCPTLVPRRQLSTKGRQPRHIRY